MELHKKLLENITGIKKKNILNNDKNGDMVITNTYNDGNIKKGCIYKLNESSSNEKLIISSDKNIFEKEKKKCVLQYCKDEEEVTINNKEGAKNIDIPACRPKSMSNIFEKEKESFNINISLCSNSSVEYSTKDNNYFNDEVNNFIDFSNSLTDENIELKSLKRDVLYSSPSNENFSNLKDSKFMSFSHCASDFVHIDKVDREISPKEEKINTLKSLVNESIKKKGNDVNVGYTQSLGDDQSDGRSAVGEEASCKEKVEDSEDDKEIKNILTVLQNLREYKFNDSNTIDNDANYEQIDENDGAEETSFSHNDDNGENNKKVTDCFIHDSNTPFLGNEYTFNSTYISEDKENLDFQKIKEKYKKYAFSLSDCDEYQENNHVVEPHHENVADEVDCDVGAGVIDGVSDGVNHSLFSNGSDGLSGHQSDHQEEGYNVEVEYSNGDRKSDMHKNYRFSNDVVGNTFCRSTNNIKKKKKRKKKDPSQDCDSDFPQFAHPEGGFYHSSNSARNSDKGTEGSTGNRTNRTNLSRSNSTKRSILSRGFPSQNYDDNEDNSAEVCRQCGECEGGVDMELETNMHKDEVAEGRKKEDISSTRTCNNVTEKEIPCHKKEGKNSEDMRKKKLLRENISNIKNKEKNDLNNAGDFSTHVSDVNFTHSNRDFPNVGCYDEIDETKNVSPQSNDISGEMRNEINANSTLVEENLEFDHYLRKLHNLKNLLRQDGSGSEGGDSTVAGVSHDGGSGKGSCVEGGVEGNAKSGEKNGGERDKSNDTQRGVQSGRRGGSKSENSGSEQVKNMEERSIPLERNHLLEGELSDLQGKIVSYKKMERNFRRDREKYKKKVALISKYEKKIDYIIMDFNKLKEVCTSKEKKLAKFEALTKYMNEQFTISKIQFENKMNEYVIFLKKKDSEIYMLKELIKEKEKIITFNENILKQYKNDIDDMLRQNIERVDNVKEKLKRQLSMITERDIKIKKIEEDNKNYTDKISRMEKEIKKMQFKAELDDEKWKELKKCNEMEKEKNMQLNLNFDQVCNEKNCLHYKVENLLQNEKQLINDKIELSEFKKTLIVENEQIKHEMKLMITEKEKTEEMLNSFKEEKKKMKEELDLLKKELEDNTYKLAKQKEELNHLEKKNVELKEERDQIERKNLIDITQISDLNILLEETKKEKLLYMNQKELLQNQVDELVKWKNETVVKNEQDVKNLREKLKDVEDKLKESNKIYEKEKDVIQHLNDDKKKLLKECDKLKNKYKKITTKMKENDVKNKKLVNEVINEKDQKFEKEKDKFLQKVHSLELAFQQSYDKIYEQKNNLEIELNEMKIINDDIKKNSKNLLNVNDVLIKEMKTYNLEKENFIKGLRNIKQAYQKIKSENDQLKKNSFEYIKKEVEENYVSVNIHNTLLNEQKSLTLEKDMLKSQLKENETILVNMGKEKSLLEEELNKIRRENDDLTTNIRVKSKITEDAALSVEKLKTDLAAKDEEIKKKTLEVKNMEREYKKLLDDYKAEKKSLVSKYENELDIYMRKCEFSHARSKKCEDETKELKNKLKLKDEVLEYTHKEIENIKESFCTEYESKIKSLVGEKEKEVHALQRKCKELHEGNNASKGEIAKLSKLLEDANKKIKKRDMEMYILLEENKKQKEKAAKKMTKVNQLLNNIQKEYTDNIP
ncbi:hypothetical protein, conserved [Plasmodium ovale curtisi]|uniref:Uncharacterized protein n=1 Tax=Plasmodium ovale curtisi TaxID=864141 RepID=A0A1A8WGB4_PLAOA|nr:hypothetical protein, conserved [Plasmodium ovale curtisi]